MNRFGLALLFATFLPPGLARAEFKVLSALGNVSVQHNGTLYPAKDRQPLGPLDAVTTGTRASASILAETSIVYLGPATSVRRAREGNALWLGRGQIRVANGSPTRLRVATPHGQTVLGTGIFNVSVEPQRTRLGSEAGRAVAYWQHDSVVPASFAHAEAPTETGAPTEAAPTPAQSQTQSSQVETGEELTIPNNQSSTTAAPSEADGPPRQPQIDVNQLQQQAADAAQRDQATTQANQQRNLAQQQQQQQRSPGQNEDRRRPMTSQNQSTTGSAIASISGFSASPGATASAGLFADADQATDIGRIVAFPPPGLAIGDPFPGNIHLVSGESRYVLPNVSLTASEKDAIFTTPDDSPVYYSIGLGDLPTSQVSTDFRTASGATPEAVKIPRFDAYVVRFEEFGVTDPALDPTQAEQSPVGILGLLGVDPTAPTVTGATPLLDERARINEGATFALGEFRLRLNDDNQFELAVRRSDQDRIIVKDPAENDANDQVVPNPDVGNFVDVADSRFPPETPTVKVPVVGSYDSSPTRYSQLNVLRRAAATTIVADQLHDFARRTGQTRFVVDGKIVDISGYRKK